MLIDEELTMCSSILLALEKMKKGEKDVTKLEVEDSFKSFCITV